MWVDFPILSLSPLAPQLNLGFLEEAIIDFWRFSTNFPSTITPNGPDFPHNYSSDCQNSQLSVGHFSAYSCGSFGLITKIVFKKRNIFILPRVFWEPQKRKSSSAYEAPNVWREGPARNLANKVSLMLFHSVKAQESMVGMFSSGSRLHGYQINHPGLCFQASTTEMQTSEWEGRGPVVENHPYTKGAILAHSLLRKPEGSPYKLGFF